jgi:hypothetical protein
MAWCGGRVYRQGNIPLLFTSMWQLLVHTAPQVSMQRATVNQHLPAHHEGWMVNGEETVFCRIPGPYLTMVVSSVAFFLLPTY